MIKWLEKNRSVAVQITIVIAIAIFLFSSVPGTAEEPGIPKMTLLASIYHFSIFFVFNFLVLASIKGEKKLKPRHIIITLLIALLYSVLDEIHQIFVLYRYSTLQDVLTNNLGIFVSTIVYLYINKKSS